MLNSLYNYVFGYTKVNCSNCNTELIVKNFIKSGDISCSNSCTFELYNKFQREREKREQNKEQEQ